MPLLRSSFALALVLPALAACGGDTTTADAGLDAGLDAAPDDLGAVDAPAAPDEGVDAAVDAGPPDLGSWDAGPSMCSPVPIAPPCSGTMRTVMGRPYCIHVPPGYHDGTPVPVVMMLHGYSTDGETQATYLGLNQVSDVRTFLLVKPNGTMDSVGLRFWNATPACCSMFATAPPDDVAYLLAVLDDVEAAYSVDTAREYVMGHSNGAFMTQRLACEHGARFAAAASLAGAADLSCTPATPVSLLEVHGDADLTILYGGGTNVGASVPYPSVEETMAHWAAADGCGPTRRELETRELLCDTTDHETHVERYSGCAAGTTVELWRMAGGGHIPSFREPDWPMGVVDFLFAHTR